MLAVRWVAWDELKRLCTVVVAGRPGSNAVRREAGVKPLDMVPVGISSSEIRARLLAGRSIRYRVPYAVERFIGQQRLYQDALGTTKGGTSSRKETR